MHRGWQGAIQASTQVLQASLEGGTVQLTGTRRQHSPSRYQPRAPVDRRHTAACAASHSTAGCAAVAPPPRPLCIPAADTSARRLLPYSSACVSVRTPPHPTPRPSHPTHLHLEPSRCEGAHVHHCSGGLADVNEAAAARRPATAKARHVDVAQLVGLRGVQVRGRGDEGQCASMPGGAAGADAAVLASGHCALAIPA